MTANGSGQKHPTATRRARGKTAYFSGLAAEQTVERAYRDIGAKVLETRWRGQGGEIDMILQQGNEIVFCEVKKAQSFDEAISRLRPAQMQRIHASASEYLVNVPAGQLTEVRFDLAVVDETGRAEILRNAFSHF